MTNARRGLDRKGKKYSVDMIATVKQKIGGQGTMGAKNMRELAAEDEEFQKVWQKALENSKQNIY